MNVEIHMFKWRKTKDGLWQCSVDATLFLRVDPPKAHSPNAYHWTVSTPESKGWIYHGWNNTEEDAKHAAVVAAKMLIKRVLEILETLG